MMAKGTLIWMDYMEYKAVMVREGLGHRVRPYSWWLALDWSEYDNA